MKSYRTLASASLAFGGLILIGMGFYFALLRPSLLPEDARYIGKSAAQIQLALPGLSGWLGHVFGVLGGYMAATGLLTVYVAATSFRAGTRGARSVVAVAGLLSIGWMAIENFLISSDFKWLLAAFTLPWMIALTLDLLTSSGRVGEAESRKDTHEIDTISKEAAIE
ncbi:MAG: hypothetical protein ABIO43_11595 [Sphingomicrobium sp.]